MAEKEPVFSEEQKEYIAKQSVVVAGHGEAWVSAMADFRVKLLVNVALSKKEILTIETPDDEIKLTKAEARQKAEVINEIVRRARAILQFEGRDDVSIRDKFFREAGMGSLFDPNSEASKLSKFPDWYFYNV